MFRMITIKRLSFKLSRLICNYMKFLIKERKREKEMSRYSWRRRRCIAVTERKWIHENNLRQNEIRRYSEIKLICWRVPYPAFLHEYRDFFLNSTLERHPHIFTVVTSVCIARLLLNTTMWFLIRTHDSYSYYENQSQPFDIKSAIGIKYEYRLLSSAGRFAIRVYQSTLRRLANRRLSPGNASDATREWEKFSRSVALTNTCVTWHLKISG